MFASSCLLCDQRVNVDPETEVCGACANIDLCGTCGRSEDDGVKLVHVEHENDLWCRECIAKFPAICGVRERMMMLAAGSVC